MPSKEHDSIQQWFLDEIPQNVTKEVNVEGLSKRRLDITFENPKIAIEIQCSPIKVKEIRARNLDITLSGYYPIWVFGRSFYQKARRPWFRYGRMISKAEEYTEQIYKCIFYSNKYDLFLSKFKYKWGCEYKGWHTLTKLSILGFFKEVQKIYELKLC